VVDPVPDAFTAKVPVPDCSEGVYTIAYACPEKLDGVSIVNVVVEFIPVIIAALDPHSNIPPSIAFVNVVDVPVTRLETPLVAIVPALYSCGL
jgi:hypothetical protein